MEATKQQYLLSVRANTAYPTYRGIIGLIVQVYYVIAALTALAGLITAFTAGGFFSGLMTVVVGLVVAALICLLARFFKEAALILADMGDSTVDANSQKPAAR